MAWNISLEHYPGTLARIMSLDHGPIDPLDLKDPIDPSDLMDPIDAMDHMPVPD